MRCFGPTYLSDSTRCSFWLDSAVPRRTEPTCHRPTPTASMTATSWACVISRANTTSASTAGSTLAFGAGPPGRQPGAAQHLRGSLEADMSTRVPRDKRAQRKQVNIRVQPVLCEALESIARQERRSLPQVVRQLLEDGLRLRADAHTTPDDTAGREIARLAAAGGAFDWLDEEPDLYDDGDGEPI